MLESLRRRVESPSWRAAVLAALVMVAGPALHAAPAQQRVFIETDVGSHDPYVQAATRVTVRVYSARALYHPDLDLPATADALVRQIGSDEHGSVQRDGRSYDVLTRQYLVFPQRSGNLTLPGAALNAQVLMPSGRSSDPFRMNRGGPPYGQAYGYGYGGMSIAVEPLQLRGDSIVLHVRPRPAGAVSSYWMPARQVTITSAWQPGTLQAHVGDALTLDVTVQAAGLTAEQLPDVTALLAVPAGMKIYPEEPKLDNFDQGDTVVGRRQQSVALIANRPGRFRLPALRLRWWDTVHDAPQEVMLPSRTLDITAAPLAPAGARGAAAGDGALGQAVSAVTDPWRWATLALGAAWLLTLAAWYVAQRRLERAPSKPRGVAAVPTAAGASRSRAAFLEACKRNDAGAARRHLIAWAGAEWPGSPPSGLGALAKRLGDAELARLLRELDRACFAGGAWRGEGLAHALARWPAHQAGTGRSASAGGDGKSPLAPLYP